MPSWTNPEDVTGAWIGDDAPDDTDLIQVWIDKAEREIKYRVVDIVDRIAAEAAEVPARTDLVTLAKDVVVAMVTRLFRNPRGVRQTTTTTGPFSDSETLAGDSLGGLGMTDDEVKKLVGKRGGAFEIDLMPRRRT